MDRDKNEFRDTSDSSRLEYQSQEKAIPLPPKASKVPGAAVISARFSSWIASLRAGVSVWGRIPSPFMMFTDG